MNCAKCGLPILYGVASYGGPHCMCHTKPNYDHNALADLLKERDQLKTENERLRSSLSEATARFAHEQRTRTATDTALEGYLTAGISAANAERDALRKQLDEARELLIKICSHHLDGNIRTTVRDCVNGLPCVQDIYGYCDNIDADIYAWLEENKP